MTKFELFFVFIKSMHGIRMADAEVRRIQGNVTSMRIQNYPRKKVPAEMPANLIGGE
jgi:hypothetical protein